MAIVKNKDAKLVTVKTPIDNESRRIEMDGSGRTLYGAMLKVARHPQKTVCALPC